MLFQPLWLARFGTATVLLLSALATLAPAGEDARLAHFRERVAPLLQHHCIECHQGEAPAGELDMTTRAGLLKGGESGLPAIDPGDAENSYLWGMITGGEFASMPKDADPLQPEALKEIQKWLNDGAMWPAGIVLVQQKMPPWSFQPLAAPSVPEVRDPWPRNEIDAFLLKALRERGLRPSPEADRRTLIRRLYFDLHGLPPDPAEVEAFVADPDPQAYKKLVDRLLASPRYGERWARHWLDVAHYGDTHGFDKDKLRDNAWPYRDYVIRAFNEDKPYGQFVKEQLAADTFAPGTRETRAALGFIVAGPWDFVGQVEVRPGTVEKKRVLNLDRDDMVTVTANTFLSVTAQCARCHDHKFDPISQEDYYSLQAVFAGVSRGEVAFDLDPEVARRRAELEKSLDEVQKESEALAKSMESTSDISSARFGYHSGIAARANETKWLQFDFGQPTDIDTLIYVACHDDFAGIGDGFGFPVRFKIEASNDPAFRSGVTMLVDETAADVANPGTTPTVVPVSIRQVRYIRFTATQLAERQNDYIFALGEFAILDPQGRNVAGDARITALDETKAPPRWARENVIDGIYHGASPPVDWKAIANGDSRDVSGQELALEDLRDRRQALERELAELPPRERIYSVQTGTPSPVHLLGRGEVTQPLREVQPGAISRFDWRPARFAEPGGTLSGPARRAALAEWIVDRRNGLTWRSIVNRIWLHHFGQGFTSSPNDFGHMSSEPSHPELLDWLAVRFRDGGQSIKDLHRLIVTSAAYRQESVIRPDAARVDAGNRYLWRMNPRRLEAEAVRDQALALAGKLNRQMYGPPFRAFQLKDDHSPHYNYQAHDPDDPSTHRRAIYRTVVRSVPNPFMETLDCADPNAIVGKRNQSLTALQALALLNNKFMVRMSEHFAARVASPARPIEQQVTAAFRLAFGRDPDPQELDALVGVATEQGMPSACRVIFNMNEFVYVD